MKLVRKVNSKMNGVLNSHIIFVGDFFSRPPFPLPIGDPAGPIYKLHKVEYLAKDEMGFVQTFLESNHFKQFLEVNHEFFIVYSVVSVDVRTYCNGNNFRSFQVDLLLPEALCVLLNLKEAILVSIILFDHYTERG